MGKTLFHINGLQVRPGEDFCHANTISLTTDQAIRGQLANFDSTWDDDDMSTYDANSVAVVIQRLATCSNEMTDDEFGHYLWVEEALSKNQTPPTESLRVVADLHDRFYG